MHQKQPFFRPFYVAVLYPLCITFRQFFLFSFIICSSRQVRIIKYSKIQQPPLITLLNLMENLPVELVGTNILGFLAWKDIVMLERTCGSKKSLKHFLDLIPYCPPVVLPSCKHTNQSVLDWFANKKCRIEYLTIQIPGDNPGLNMSNLVLSFDLQIIDLSRIRSYKFLIDNKVGNKVRSIKITGYQYREVMEQLSACTGNVKQLTISYSDNCMDWLTVDVLSRWKLKNISFEGPAVTTSLMKLIVQTCTELTSIKQASYKIDDSAVIDIAQHCPKLQTLKLESSSLTYNSLLALSERGLPLKELHMQCILTIPTADIAKRCSHALSCIRYLHTDECDWSDQDASVIIPYLTELTYVYLNCHFYSYISLLTQYWHKLTEIVVLFDCCTVEHILSLCRANPLLQVLNCDFCVGLTDTSLIELIHTCPHLHTLYLPYETDITDTGILALSEHCPQLQEFVICRCHQITETSILQLLQRCRKLTKQYISHSSLSEETWTQLDKNTQKRVIRCW